VGTMRLHACTLWSMECQRHNSAADGMLRVKARRVQPAVNVSQVTIELARVLRSVLPVSGVRVLDRDYDSNPNV